MKTSLMEKRLLNIRETSEYLGVTVNTLYCWVSQRRIPFVKIGKRTMFDYSHLNDYIDEHTHKPLDFERKAPVW